MTHIALHFMEDIRVKQAQSNLNDLQGHINYIKTLKISFRNSSDKNENSVIIYAFSCKSKPV